MNLDAAGAASVLTELEPDGGEGGGLLPGSLAEEAAKLAAIPAGGVSVREAENIRNMFFVMASGIRPILLILANSLSTARRLDSFPGEEQKNLAQECLDIYAPLAERLGIFWLKSELEDLSLKQLNRDVYGQIKEIVALKRDERGEFLESVKALVKKEAGAAGIAVELESRAKHFYSIYQKMRRRNKAPGALFDLFGIRILCPEIENCYTLLGLVHRLWKPVDGRFKDYIASPKPNGYQSLHTTILAGGKMLEIQIRTFLMHRTAEYGAAGHWFYKHRENAGSVPAADGGDSPSARPKHWDEDSGERFLEEIRRDLPKNRVCVFTPRGKILELSEGATALDFAYAVHSAVGDHCMAAKANGAIIPLGAALKNAQVVEILTASNAHPSRNWLNQVKTGKARNKIRQWLTRQEPKPEQKKKEKAAPEPPQGQTPAEPKPGKEPLPVQERYYTARTERNGSPVFKVRADGEKNMLFRLARCCNPVLGDPITGYVSRGRGIIIHRSNCRNLSGIPDFDDRRIETQWEDAGLTIRRFRVEARQKTAELPRAGRKNESGLFSEIEGAVRKFQGHLIEGRLEELEETSARHLTGYFTMQLESPADAARVIRHIRNIPAVYSIQSVE